MDITYRPQDTKEVEPDNSFAVGQPVDEAFKELGFSHAYCDTGG